MATTIELLQKQLEEIEKLKLLDSSESPDFQQWEQVTKTIIERRLNKQKADRFPSDYDFWPNHIGPWDPEELKESLLKGLAKAEAYLKALVQEIELLGETSSEEILHSSSKTLPSMKFGEGGRNGQPGGGGSVFIQAHHFSMSDSGRISADGGSIINTTHGQNSPITINLGEINNVIEEFERKFEAEYKGENKEEIQGFLTELKAEAAHGNERGFKEITGKLLTKGAEIAQIAAFVVQVLSLISGTH